MSLFFPSRLGRRVQVRLKLALIAVAATLIGVLVAAPVAPAATNPSLSVPITATGTNAVGQTLNFVGQFTLQSFQVVNGQLAGVGTVTGTLTNTATGAVTQISQQVILPLLGASATGSCQILHLELGPLDLNLLGLMVHLDRVVLDITAQPGPGNLLGNLLCGVAHLLDSNGALSGVAQVLNNLLARL
jgi:hypothetical protein